MAQRSLQQLMVLVLLAVSVACSPAVHPEPGGGGAGGSNAAAGSDATSGNGTGGRSGTSGPGGASGGGVSGGGVSGGGMGGSGGASLCRTPPTDLVTDFSGATVSGASISLGVPPNLSGGTYSYAAPGLVPPTLALTACPDSALSVHVHPGPSSSGSDNWLGIGLFLNGCFDARAYDGVEFTISGELGNCSLRFSSEISEDTMPANHPLGTCTAATCYSPSSRLITQPGTTRIRFADESGGTPVQTVDPATITSLAWTMNTPQDGVGCTADFTLDDVRFVTIPPTPPLCTGVPPLGVEVTDPANGLLSNVFSEAAPGLSKPTVRLTPAKPGSTEQVIGVAANPGVPTDAGNATVDVGLSFDGCIDASAFSGVEFTIAGDLGSCALGFSASPSEDVGSEVDPSHGSCAAEPCTSPESAVVLGANQIAFSDLFGGSPASSPTSPFDSSRLTSMRWVLTAPTGAGMPACAANFSISDVRFLPAQPVSVTISTAEGTPRTATWSANYWTWAPTYGDAVTGTEDLVGALKPALLRAGGYNNDANSPDPFGAGALDRFVAYARAVGAQPLLQVPLLYGTNGKRAVVSDATDMVEYANVTMGYGVKYFALGNEPDLYPDQGALDSDSLPAIAGYTPEAYCATARDYVTQMKAIDPSIQIVGPDLGYKYQPFNDWLTPILSECGDLFDIVSIHRYPFSSQQCTLQAAEGDALTLSDTVGQVRDVLRAAGQGDKPLALTEVNIAYDQILTPLPASPGTVPAALWLADSIGTGLELGVWTTAVWDISDPDAYALGLLRLPPSHEPRPAYYALLLYAEHFGPTLVPSSTSNPELKVHASRNQAGDGTEAILVNWSQSAQAVTVGLDGLSPSRGSVGLVMPALSMAAVEIPDQGAASAWIYGQGQFASGTGPAELALTP